MVEFVSYNGKFPNLCSGTLIIRVNGEEFTLEAPCLCSGGKCGNGIGTLKLAIGDFVACPTALNSTGMKFSRL